MWLVINNTNNFWFSLNRNDFFKNIFIDPRDKRSINEMDENLKTKLLQYFFKREEENLEIKE